MLPVCSFCGFIGHDFNYCENCKRKLPKNELDIPTSQGTHKKDTTVTVDKIDETSEAVLLLKEEKDTTSERESLFTSSDKEHCDKKRKRLNNSNEASSSQNIAQTEECNVVLGAKEQEHLTNLAISDLNTYLTCRTVRIGSYKYVPTNDIFISASGFKLKVPPLENKKLFITVDIEYADLIRVLIHFSKSIQVLFFYLNVDAGTKIKNLLKMTDPEGPYFDPSSDDLHHKIITLLPNKISKDSKKVVKELFRPILKEISAIEANEILVRSFLKTQALFQKIQEIGIKKEPKT